MYLLKILGIWVSIIVQSVSVTPFGFAKNYECRLSIIIKEKLEFESHLHATIKLKNKAHL